jgi:Tol biopolymer transport system component
MQNAVWQVGLEHTVLYHLGTSLFAFGIDVDVALPKKLIADSARSKDGRLLVVQSNQQSTVSYLDQNGVASLLAYLPKGHYQFVESPSAFIALRETEQRRLVLLDPTLRDPLLFNEETHVWDWSPDQNSFVYSSGFDIKIFPIATGQTETLTRFSEPIHDLVWYPLGSVVVYAQASTVKTIELDRRDHRQEFVLVQNKIIRDLWASDDGSSLFFWGDDENGSRVFEKKLQK